MSGQLNPLQYPERWDTLELAGIVSPGVIPANGIRGFDRKSAFQMKAGKGVAGAALTRVQQPNAKGTVLFHLGSVPDFYQADVFRAAAMSALDAPAGQGGGSFQALAISHPAFQDINITQVITDFVGPIKHAGKGLYTMEVGFTEWIAVQQQSVVATPTQATQTGVRQPIAFTNTSNATPSQVALQIATGNAQQAGDGYTSGMLSQNQNQPPASPP